MADAFTQALDPFISDDTAPLAQQAAVKMAQSYDGRKTAGHNIDSGLFAEITTVAVVDLMFAVQQLEHRLAELERNPR